jgi:hypothetical protein
LGSHDVAILEAPVSVKVSVNIQRPVRVKKAKMCKKSEDD